jgi:hypothetical protein
MLIWIGMIGGMHLEVRLSIFHAEMFVSSLTQGEHDMYKKIQKGGVNHTVAEVVDEVVDEDYSSPSESDCSCESDSPGSTDRLHGPEGVFR